jgi:hypothetical protein
LVGTSCDGAFELRVCACWQIEECPLDAGLSFFGGAAVPNRLAVEMRGRKSAIETQIYKERQRLYDLI